jgi:hypothetical protein
MLTYAGHGDCITLVCPAIVKEPIDEDEVPASPDACSRMLTYAHVCSRMLTYAHVCSRMLAYAHVCSRMRLHHTIVCSASITEAIDGHEVHLPRDVC